MNLVNVKFDLHSRMTPVLLQRRRKIIPVSAQAEANHIVQHDMSDSESEAIDVDSESETHTNMGTIPTLRSQGLQEHHDGSQSDIVIHSFEEDDITEEEEVITGKNYR